MSTSVGDLFDKIKATYFEYEDGDSTLISVSLIKTKNICADFEQRLAEAEEKYKDAMADLILQNTDLKVAHDRISQLEGVVAEKDKAMQDVIDYNLQHAEDQYGDRNKAEHWSCVVRLREGLALTAGQPEAGQPRSGIEMLNDPQPSDLQDDFDPHDCSARKDTDPSYGHVEAGQVQIQACREGDRAMLQTEAGQQLVKGVVKMLQEEQPMTFGDSGGGSEGRCKECGYQGLHDCPAPATPKTKEELIALLDRYIGLMQRFNVHWDEVVKEPEPVAYRYKTARGIWRYVGAPLTEGWDFPENLNHEPLYLYTRAAVPDEALVLLDELWADQKYLFGRVAADGSAAHPLAASTCRKIEQIKTLLAAPSRQEG